VAEDDLWASIRCRIRRGVSRISSVAEEIIGGGVLLILVTIIIIYFVQFIEFYSECSSNTVLLVGEFCSKNGPNRSF